METGLVKTTSLTAAPAAMPRPRGTVRAVGLFSSVTSRQANVPVRSGSGNAPGGFGTPAAFSTPAGVSTPAGITTPASVSSLVGGNAPGRYGSHAGGNPAAMSHLAGSAVPSVSAGG